MAFSQRFQSCCFWALMSASVHAAAPDKNAKPEATDVSSRVQVTFEEGLRSPDGTTHEVFVVLKNTSRQPITGPLAVTFDGGQATEYWFDWYTNTLQDGQEYYGLVDVDEVLPANQSSRRKKLYLKTAEPLEVAERENFDIPLKVVRLEAEHVESKRPVDEQVAGKKYDRAELDRVMAIQERAADHILATYQDIGVVALAEDDKGSLVIQVHAERRGAARNLPKSFEGVPVDVTVSGEFVFHAPPTGTVNQRRSVYPIPVPIGVSSFNEILGCATGTLGCRVVDRTGTVYALSNNHVYAGENDGLIGQIIAQPGPLDTFPRCNLMNNTNIATLSQFVAYLPAFTSAADSPVNYVDAAIAISSPQNLDFQTPLGAYGVPSRQTVPQPALRTPIQKMGRTTGFTQGFITGFNAKGIIGGSNGPVYFERMMVIGVKESGIFGASGDSGSLVVTLNGNRPVGLYFAGSSVQGLMNPIDLVLQSFEVGVDDGALTPAGTPVPFGGHKGGRMGIAVGPRNRGIAPRR